MMNYGILTIPVSIKVLLTVKINIMNGIVKAAIQSELDAMKRMKDSMKESVAHLSGLSTGNSTIMVVKCPEAAQTMARMSAGLVNENEMSQEMIVSIAGDLGHDVSFGLDNARGNVAIGDRKVEQVLNRADHISWEQVTKAVSDGLEYLEAKEKILLGALGESAS